MDKKRHLEKTVMRTQVHKWVINIRQVVKVEFMHGFKMVTMMAVHTVVDN